MEEEDDDDEGSDHEALDGYIVTEMIDELAETDDAEVAMRKALLALLVLTTESTSSPMRTFRDFLLEQFAPLADVLMEGDNRYQLFGDIEGMRARLHNDDLALFLHRK